MKNGRKSKYRRWMCRLALELFKQGKSRAQVCAKLNISSLTIRNYIAQFPSN